MTLRTGWIAMVLLAVSCALVPGVVAGPEDKAGRGEAKVNINEASKAQLMKLAGVGAGVAERIIAFRQAHGPFKRVQDLGKVEGVGRGVLEKNQGRLSVK
ncbi:MAG: helix-hairpin-helix domain-containing protein [Candidatus Rokubacteria bacterium]|nr:helix-hairpin-helix domain-containing protein [Candidatus Rokubacteria bacterium]